jgi:hypothetical protein
MKSLQYNHLNQAMKPWGENRKSSYDYDATSISTNRFDIRICSIEERLSGLFVLLVVATPTRRIIYGGEYAIVCEGGDGAARSCSFHGRYFT